MRKRRHRRGYILVTTVLLIAIAGLLLAGVARRSLMAALDVKQAQDELQIRWGEASCQRLVFRRAPFILKKQVESKSLKPKRRDEGEEIPSVEVPIPRRAAAIELGGIEFQLQIADEQAKANLNRVLVERSDEAAIEIMRTLAASSDLPSIFFRKNKNFDLSPRKAAFESWGQVFESTDTNSVLLAEQLRLSTQRLTLWGPDGKLHFAAADDETLAEIAKLAISPAEAGKLVEMRAKSPDALSAQFLNSLGLNAKKRTKLESLLTDSSRCYSLWITSKDSAGTVRSKLIVQDTIDESTKRIHVSIW
ncbi:MAG: hypothetical protein ABL888_14110 [Pirellulaceae bacterium]